MWLNAAHNDHQLLYTHTIKKIYEINAKNKNNKVTNFEKIFR